MCGQARWLCFFLVNYFLVSFIKLISGSFSYDLLCPCFNFVLSFLTYAMALKASTIRRKRLESIKLLIFLLPIMSSQIDVVYFVFFEFH